MAPDDQDADIQARLEDERVQWLLAEWRTRLPYYRLYRNYYDGRHSLITVNERYQVWFSNLLKYLRLNLCESVVDAVVDRLEILSWDPVVAEVETNGADKTAQRTAIDKAWEFTGGMGIMNEVHESASVEGDGYVLVWPDGKGQSRMWPHRGDEMLVYYPPELPDLPEVAIKIWEDLKTKDSTKWRLNVYYADHVDRYSTTSNIGSVPDESSSSKWQPVDDDEHGPTIDNPMGGEVPIAHFTSGRATNKIGRSDLKNAVAVQDALNKALIDLVVSGEGLALPLRIMTGVQVMPDPETGAETGPRYDPRKDTWFNVANEQARLWTATGADVKKLIETVEHHIVNMARVTKTPPERLLAEAGGVMSGVSRKVAEAPLVSKASTRKQWYTPSWMRAMRLMGHAGTPAWAPSTFETDEERLEQARTKIEIGIPLRQVLIELGYTESEVRDMLAQSSDLERGLGDALTRAFREGRDPARLLSGDEDTQ